MLVGVSGLAGSGKDAAADFLVENHNFAKVALADPLKRICKDVFQFTDEQLWGTSSARNAEDKRFFRKTETNEFGDPLRDVYLTPRYALQQLGSEWGRDCFRNIWVDYAIRISQAIMRDLQYTYLYSAKEGLHNRQPLYAHEDRPYTGVVISDVRFKNEISAIKAAGGILIRMLRGRGLEGEAAKHISETEQQSIPDSEFDFIIDNREWSLSDLEEEIDELVTVRFPTLLVKRKTD